MKLFHLTGLKLKLLPGKGVSRSVMINSATPWAVAHQAPLSKGFSRQEYGSGCPFPSPRDLPDPGIEPGSFALQADSLPSETIGNCSSNSEEGNGNPLHCSCLENPRDRGT